MSEHHSYAFKELILLGSLYPFLHLVIFSQLVDEVNQRRKISDQDAWRDSNPFPPDCRMWLTGMMIIEEVEGNDLRGKSGSSFPISITVFLKNCISICLWFVSRCLPKASLVMGVGFYSVWWFMVQSRDYGCEHHSHIGWVAAYRVNEGKRLALSLSSPLSALATMPSSTTLNCCPSAMPPCLRVS